jgi:hypothetical protein
MRPPVNVPLILIALGLLAILALGAGGGAAQTNPPALGDGDWTVRDDTVIRDWGVIMLRGDLLVTDGGSLTISNTTVLFVNSEPGEHGTVVANGGSLRIIDGSTVGSSRPGVAWTCVVNAGCDLLILDSFIEECGKPAFGLTPNWREIALYVGTSDARVENTSFTGGLAGLYFEDGVYPSPVRNCTFENAYGIISWGAVIEDCTFQDQTIYGVVFHGGTTGRISRCLFDNVVATCLQVGYEYFEPTYQLFTAKVRIEDNTFVTSARAIRVLGGSEADVVDNHIDGMEREGIVVWTTARVEIVNGDIYNSSIAILTEDGSFVNWTVTSSSQVVGGNLSLSGNIHVLEGATLELLEVRDMLMFSRSTSPLTIELESEALFRLVNGTLDVPPNSTIPEGWSPVRLVPHGADLDLVGVSVLDVTGIVLDIRNLTARDTYIPLGDWRAQSVDLVDCTLDLGMVGMDVQLVIEGGIGSIESRLERCTLLGIESYPTSKGSWLSVQSGVVTSVDFLYDLGRLLEDGLVEITGGVGTRLDVHWSAQAHVHWQNQLPIVDTLVRVDDSRGFVSNNPTGSDGYTDVFHVLTEQAWGNNKNESYLPLLFGVSIAGTVSNETITGVTASILVDIPVVDLHTPNLVVDQGLMVATNTTEIELTGRATDDHSGVAFLEAALLPFGYSRVPVEKGTGHFDVTFSLKPGFQTISFRLYDSVGNRRVVEVEAFYSTNPPFILIEEPIENTWYNTSFAYIVGLTDIGSVVEVDGRLQLAENGTFRMLAELREGVNLLTINVTNPAGNRNTTSIQVYLDTKEPTLEIVTPSSIPFETRSSREDIRGITEPGVLVFINSVSIDVTDGGTFSARISLDEGARRVTVMAMDLAGNVNSSEVVFVLDSVPPSLVVVVDGMDGSKFTDEGLLRTSAPSVPLIVSTEEGAILEVNDEEVALVGNEAFWDHELAEGLNEIMIRVEDKAGNWVEFGPIFIEVDRTPPLLELDRDLPQATEDALLSLKGHTEPNVTITVNGAPIPVDIEGAFIKNFLLSEGRNRLVVHALDRYGQNTTLVYEVEMTPSVPPPVEGPDSKIPIYILIAVVILVIEGVILQLWWIRRRRGSDEVS